MTPFATPVFKRAAAAALLLFGAACTSVPLHEPRKEAESREVMVAAAHPLAVEAGLAVLQLGGGAVDAAVAVQFVLGLVEPEASGLGGGAFMLHWSEKERKLRAYDGRETAPAGARADRFLDGGKKPLAFRDAAASGRSVGVPGVLRLLEMAYQRHGRLRWAELLQYAIFAAEEGWEMSPRLHAQLEKETHLRNDPQARALFYGADGRPKPVGSRLTNRAYGETVRTLAFEGVESFYRGPIAADIVSAVRSHPTPGDLTEEDLASYKAVEREPLCGPYREWRVCSFPPPSSGGVAVLQILGMLERTPFKDLPLDSERALHLYAEASRLAFADRARFIGDPDFVSVPTQALVEGRYLEKRVRLIGERAIGLAPAGDPEVAGTTHFTIVDAQGDVVSMTSTIEATFGSRIMARGFLLNNELTDFDFTPNSRNEVEPRKRPRSSMAPTVVFGRDGAVRLAVGSPGGPFIIHYVAKTLIGTLERGLSIGEAIRLPNFANRNGATEIERGTRYEGSAEALRARGHEVVSRELASGLHGVERTASGWRGAADPRRGGAAAGY